MTVKTAIEQIDLDEAEKRVITCWVSLDMTGEDLKRARTRLGITQQELAVLLGYQNDVSSRKQVYMMESGRKDIQPSHARLVKAYLAGYRPPDWPEDKNDKAEIGKPLDSQNINAQKSVISPEKTSDRDMDIKRFLTGDEVREVCTYMKDAGFIESDRELCRMLGLVPTTLVRYKAKGVDRGTALAFAAILNGIPPYTPNSPAD